MLLKCTGLTNYLVTCMVVDVKKWYQIIPKVLIMIFFFDTDFFYFDRKDRSVCVPVR